VIGQVRLVLVVLDLSHEVLAVKVLAAELATEVEREASLSGGPGKRE
jgi:hypothetical protein